MKSARPHLIVVLACLLLNACGPSENRLVELGQRAAIQPDAPVKASSTIIIEAPRERVWRILTDLPAWQDWQPGIARVSPHAVLGNGMAFAWDTGGTTIHSRVVLFSPPNAIAWTGHADFARAVHVFTLAPLGPDRTRVESRESMDGPLLAWFYDSAALQRSEDRWLEHLKAAAEVHPDHGPDQKREPPESEKARPRPMDSPGNRAAPR